MVSDYTGGGRVHVLEVVGPDTWEWVYSTPWLDDTKLTSNQRVITGGDLDGDGHGEIIFMSGCKSFTGSGQHCDTDQKFDNAAYPQGIYVFEHTGADNDYGAEPTTIYQMPNAPDRNYPEQMTAADIDGDGSQELFFGVNGRSSIWDNWYIVSVTGDIGSGFETWNEEALISSRNNDWDPVYRGGGSPYGMVAADLDGNGITELVMSSWNNLNVTLGQIIGADTYGFPDGSLGPNYAQLSAFDDVALFGLTSLTSTMMAPTRYTAPTCTPETSSSSTMSQASRHTSSPKTTTNSLPFQACPRSASLPAIWTTTATWT